MKLFSALALCALSLPVFAGGNMLKNGDLESSISAKDFRGFDYIQPAKQKFVNIDTEVKHSGKASIRISGVGETWVALIQKSIKMEDFTKPILVRGWAKYEDVVSKLPSGRIAGMPMVGLWTTKKNGGNGPSLGIPGFSDGSKDWFPFEYTFTPEAVQKRVGYLKGEDAVVRFTFRINIATQTGTFWFDDLEMIELEDAPLAAELPVRDVSGDIAKIQISVAKPAANCVIILSAGGKEIPTSVSQAKMTIDFPIAHLPEGKNLIKITPKSGFSPDVQTIELQINKMADAFDEE